MSENEYEDGSGDDKQVRETDSLEDLRVRRLVYSIDSYPHRV
jgi:hypothetical protein